MRSFDGGCERSGGGGGGGDTSKGELSLKKIAGHRTLGLSK